MRMAQMAPSRAGRPPLADGATALAFDVHRSFFFFLFSSELLSYSIVDKAPPCGADLL